MKEPFRSAGYTGFPVVRAAETSFVRQIQRLMFDLFEEHLNLAVSYIGLEEVGDFLPAFQAFVLVSVLWALFVMSRVAAGSREYDGGKCQILQS